MPDVEVYAAENFDQNPKKSQLHDYYITQFYACSVHRQTQREIVLLPKCMKLE